MVKKKTAPVEEGPYYKTGSPERRNIAEPNMPGSRLILEGTVLDREGRPIPHAWLDFWQADSTGEYDNEGYILRGHQFSDEHGKYRLETIRPKEYLFRAAHVHAMVRASETSPIVTTQLFFPGEQRNETDPIFEPETLMNVARMEDGEHATFDFIVDTA